MITLNKNEFIKLSKNSYLCYCQKWGSEELYYMVAVKTCEIKDNELEIFGWGKTYEEALLMSVCQLSESGMKGINFSYLKDMNVMEMIECIENESWTLENPERQIPADLSEIDEERRACMAKDQSFVITIEENKCYPLMV